MILRVNIYFSCLFVIHYFCVFIVHWGSETLPGGVV